MMYVLSEEEYRALSEGQKDLIPLQEGQLRRYLVRLPHIGEKSATSVMKHMHEDGLMVVMTSEKYREAMKNWHWMTD